MVKPPLARVRRLVAVTATGVAVLGSVKLTRRPLTVPVALATSMVVDQV